MLTAFGVGSVWADDPSESIDLSKGSFSTDHITWSGTSCTVQQIKGSSSTNVNSSYVSAPRVYKGHILSFEAKTGYKIKSISITVSSTYYGNSMTAGTAISSNTVTDNTTAVSRTWTSTSGGSHVVSSVSNEGLDNIYIQNVASTNVQLRFTAISVTYIASGSQESDVCATPIFSPAAGAVESGTTVAISTTTDGATIHYTTDGNDPTTSSATYSTPIEITTATTIKAIAVKDGMNNSSVATAEYTIATPITIADVLSGISSTEGDVFLLNDVTVTYANGSNVYVKDATGYMLIYYAISGAANGKVLHGLWGKAKTYNGLPEISTVTIAPTVSDGTAVNPIALDAYPTDADLNKYVTLEGITFTSAASLSGSKNNVDGTYKGSTLVIRNNFQLSGISLETDKSYIIVGVVQKYNSTIQVYPITIEEKPVDPNEPTLSSLAITGDLATKAYEVGDNLNYSGLTVTGTYSDDSQKDETSNVVWSFTPALAEGTTTYTVTATIGEISANKEITGITVTKHEATPGKYDITLANAFWGTNGTGQNAGHTASGTQNDITISVEGESGTQNYINDSETRIYGSHTITFSVPTGYVLKEITGLGSSSKSDISVATGSTGSINTRVWTGSANSVTFTVNGRTDFTTVSVTFAEDVPVTQCATPTFSLAQGEYEGTQSVTITCETDGVTIYYTTDGTDPSTTSNVYSDAISVSATQTIKAYAVKDGLTDSEVAEAAYTISEGPDVILNLIDGNWGFPTSSSTTTTSYTNSETGYQVGCYAANGYSVNGSSYFIIGKKDSYLRLPKFDNAVEKIVVIGNSGGSGNVSFNIYDGDVAVSDPVTSCKVDQTFTIASPEPNKQYLIKVTNDNNLQMKQIKIYFGAAPAVAIPTLSGNTPFLTSTSVTLDCTTDEATIYYTTDGTDPKTSETKQIYSDPFELTATTTVKVIANKGDDWSALNSKQFVKVVPISVATALTAIDALADNGTIAEQYVQGTISQIDSYNTTYKSITYWISDDGTTTNQLEVYSGKGLNGADFSAQSDLSIGDAVVVYGTLKKYVKNSTTTPEFDSNSQIMQLTRTLAAPTFTPDGGGFLTTQNVTLNCETEDAEIRYTTDGTDPVSTSTLYSTPIELSATTTIKAASFKGSDVSAVITRTFTKGTKITVAAALEALDSEAPIANQFVYGIVSTAPTSNPSSGRLTYYISDDGTTTNQLEVYNGYGLNGAAFAAKTDLQVGDEVTVYGTLKIYNTTKEFDAGNYLLEYTRPTFAVTGVTLPATASVRAGNTITLTATIEPSNATNQNVTWSVTAGSDYAEVDANGVVTGKAEGTATIQVQTEDGDFTATCEVTVTAAAPTFTDDDHEWIKVTNDAKLVAGRYYVIASDEKDKVAGATLTGGYLEDVTATFNNGAIAYNGFGSSQTAVAGGAAVFELGGTTGAWTLTEVSEDKVLTGATTQNFAWDGATNTTWAITISDGEATIGAADGYYIRHNYGSNRFKQYAGTQNAMKVPQLYMWAELSHVVTFDANGGEAESVPNAERTDEGKIIIPATTPTHTDAAKVFAGWYVTTAPTTLYNAGDEFSTDADVTLYAKWNSVPTHTVTYVPGGTGTGIPAVTSYAEGIKVQVATVADLANPGYLFTGWVVKDAEQNIIDVDENNEFIMPTSNVTITAGWERESSQKWALVKHGDALEINAEYVIACPSKSVALGSINTSGSNYYGNSVEVAINGEILKGSSAMVAFTLVAGSADDSYAFQNGSNYLTWSSGNSLDEKSTLDNSSSWTIEMGEDNNAVIKNVGDASRQIYYNSSSPRFACYTSAQTKIQLYKKVLSATVTTADATEADIPSNADITVKDGGVLTVNNDKTIGDLIIEQGGKVVLDEKKLTVVGVFSIETTMGSGASGQLNGVTVANFEASEAYIDITLGDNANPNKWHAFTVPFPVDVLNGIYDLADNKLQNEVNYAIMDYHGDIRATGKYGWKKIRTTLVPGTFYIMATDGYRTTYRFKKKDGAALVAENSMSYSQYAESEAGVYGIDNGWNGIGNPNLFYGKVNLPVQVLNPATYTYEPYVGKDANSTNFIVGTPFFYQASADGSVVMTTADAGANYAPARYTMPKEIKDVEVRFGNEEYTDRLYISANEDALNTYETGKDLIKMTMTNTPKVAQIFGNAYNSKLCMVNAPLHNDQAIYSLTLYAPTDGEYTIAIPQVENADIYLTYDNRIIWNIAASEYNCELKAGETNNYGLILRMKAPQVTTGVEQGGVSNGANSVQKIIINDHVYILQGEKLYDVTGKMLR